MSLKITSTGLDKIIRDLHDFQTVGIARAQDALDGALAEAFDLSQGLAHLSRDKRHRGALKASGDYSSDHGPSHWVGTIAYSDRAAHWEIERGGEHAAFIDSLATMTEESFERAMDALFEP